MLDGFQVSITILVGLCFAVAIGAVAIVFWPILAIVFAVMSAIL